MIVARAATIAGVALACGCSYGAAFEDCRVACDRPDECPSGFACGTEGLCRIAGVAASCAIVLVDAQPVGDGNGSDPGTCRGTATPCRDLADASGCVAQDGCTHLSWCALANDCSMFTTHDACEAAPGCTTDFTTSTCKPISDYCQGSTPAECEATQGCAYAADCSGTARACQSYSDQTACASQAACAWR